MWDQDSGIRDSPQSSKVGPGTPPKVGAQDRLQNLKVGSQDTLQSIKVGPS